LVFWETSGVFLPEGKIIPRELVFMVTHSIQ
jgi:hypothetical protein